MSTRNTDHLFLSISGYSGYSGSWLAEISRTMYIIRLWIPSYLGVLGLPGDVILCTMEYFFSLSTSVPLFHPRPLIGPSELKRIPVAAHVMGSGT